MPKILILSCLALILSANAYAQTAPAKVTKQITAVFKNASLLPKKYMFITYQPSTPGNGTNTKIIAPKSNVTFKLEAGTKVYLANKKQIDYVMSGKNLSERTDKPFCTLADSPAKQTFTIK